MESRENFSLGKIDQSPEKTGEVAANLLSWVKELYPDADKTDQEVAAMALAKSQLAAPRELTEKEVRAAVEGRLNAKQSSEKLSVSEDGVVNRRTPGELRAEDQQLGA